MSFFVGGSNDIGSFRAALSHAPTKAKDKSQTGYLPLPSSIEYEGLYNEFYFDVGHETEKIFAPKYSYCKSADPFSQISEHYLVVGLASKYDGDGLRIHGRNAFNLVVAIDISGSMSSKLAGTNETRTKMDNLVLSVITLLKPGDCFGCVTFNDEVSTVQDLDLIENIDIPAVKQKILSLQPTGGTALSAALKRSTRLFDEFKKDEMQYRASENSILVITDLVPTKDASTTTFINTVRKNASERLYTSIVGIGVEFGSDMLKQLGKIRSCNYFSVYSAQDFKKIIDSDLAYTLSPIAFDISLFIASDQFVVERVYGSPGNEILSEGGAMLAIECMSPSPIDETNKTKGGIVLAKLAALGAGSSGILKCKLKYEDRNGNVHIDEQDVEIPESNEPNLYTTGEAGRKSVLLTRYVNISKHWLLDEPRRYLASEQEDICGNENIPEYQPTITKATGIIPPPMQPVKAKKRVPFYVDSHYSTLMKEFITHYKSETSEIGDVKLESYVIALQKIADFERSDCEKIEQALNKHEHMSCFEYLYQPGDVFEPTPLKVKAILSYVAAKGKLALLGSLWDHLQGADKDQLIAAIIMASKEGHPRVFRCLLDLGKEKFQ